MVHYRQRQSQPSPADHSHCNSAEPCVSRGTPRHGPVEHGTGARPHNVEFFSFVETALVRPKILDRCGYCNAEHGVRVTLGGQPAAISFSPISPGLFQALARRSISLRGVDVLSTQRALSAVVVKGSSIRS